MVDELKRRPENLKLKYFLEKLTLCVRCKLFSGASSFLERLAIHLSWILEEVEEVTAVLKVMVILEALLEVAVEALEMRHLSFVIWTNPNRKPNPSTGKFIEGARVVIPFIKGLSEQYRHTLAKYKVRVFFKGTSTIKSLLLHLKDPIPDAQKTDIIYNRKCPAHNCTAEYIGKTKSYLKERVSDHRSQTTSAIRKHHISTKHPKSGT